MEQDKITPQGNENAIDQEGKKINDEMIVDAALTFLSKFFSITHLASANIATNAFHLYQMPVFKNVLTLSYSISNAVAYSYGTNIYLKATSFVLATGSLYELYKGSFTPITEAIMSYMIFVQTPKIANSHLPTDVIRYSKPAYICYSFLKSIYLGYENNFGEDSAQYKKDSYDTWQKHATTTASYTRQMSSWVSKKSAIYSNSALAYQAAIEAKENDRRYKEWEKCTNPLEKKDLSYKEILKICDITECKATQSEKQSNLTSEQIFKICNDERLQLQKCIIKGWDYREELSSLLNIQIFELCKHSPEKFDSYYNETQTYKKCLFTKTDLEGESRADAISTCILQIAPPDDDELGFI